MCTHPRHHTCHPGDSRNASVSGGKHRTCGLGCWSTLRANLSAIRLFHEALRPNVPRGILSPCIPPIEAHQSKVCTRHHPTHRPNSHKSARGRAHHKHEAVRRGLYCDRRNLRGDKPKLGHTTPGDLRDELEMSSSRTKRNLGLPNRSNNREALEGARLASSAVVQASDKLEER